MARMRTLKPEFWNSPSTAEADLAVRLTFMAMWNWADDSGHGTANMKELEAFCWPNDDVRDLPRGGSGGRRGNSADGWRNFAEICGEVAEVYGVTFYRVAGRPYYEIPNFKRHQSKDYRPESRYPLPDEGEIFDVTSGNVISGVSAIDASGGPSGGGRGNSAGVAGESPLVIGEQGNRVIGEQGNRGTGEQIHARPSSSVSAGADSSAAESSRFDEFWKAYPRKVGKPKALKAYVAAVKRCGDEAIVVDGAVRVAADPNLPEKKFIPHPVTWLNRDGWDDEPFPARLPDRDSRGGFAARDWLDVARDIAGGDVIDGQVVDADPFPWSGSGPSNATSFSLEAGPVDGRRWA